MKGSYHVLNVFKELIEKNRLGDKVSLKRSYCLGNCSEGIASKVDDKFIPNLTVENCEKMFYEYVMDALESERYAVPKRLCV